MRGRYFKRRDARLPSRQRQQGAALVLVAVCLVVMLGMLGLAIDSSIAYLAKARLSLAADSAVLAAADSYVTDTARGVDPSQRAINASKVADSYFLVNYPAPFLGKHTPTYKLYSPNPLDPPFIRYEADVQYPLTFSKVISSEMLKPATSPVVTFKGSSSGGVDLAIVIDSSEIMDSFRDKYSVPRAIMYNYINKLDAANTRVSLIFAGNSSSGASGFDIPAGGKVVVKFHQGQGGFDSNEIRLALLNNKITGAQTSQGGIRLAIDELNKLSGDGAKKAIFYIGISQPDWSVFGGGESPHQELVNVAREAHQENISMYVLAWDTIDQTVTKSNYLDKDLSVSSIDGKPINWTANDLLTCIAGDPRSSTPKNCQIPPSAGNKRCSAYVMDDLSGFEACLPDASGSGPGPSLTQAVLTQ